MVWLTRNISNSLSRHVRYVLHTLEYSRKPECRRHFLISPSVFIKVCFSSALVFFFFPCKLGHLGGAASASSLLLIVMISRKFYSYERQSWNQLPRAVLLGLVWSPQPHHPLKNSCLLSCSCYNRFNYPELLYLISSCLFCFGVWGRRWRGRHMKHFLCGPWSMCGSEESWDKFSRCAWNTASSSLPPQNMTALKCKSFSCRSMKPSLVCVSRTIHRYLRSVGLWQSKSY